MGLPRGIRPVPSYGDFRRTDWTKVWFRAERESHRSVAGAEVGKISWKITKAYGRWALEGLLDALLLCVPANKGIEDRKDVAAVLDHAVEDIAEFGIALGVTVPLDHDGLRHFDIAAKLLG